MIFRPNAKALQCFNQCPTLRILYCAQEQLFATVIRVLYSTWSIIVSEELPEKKASYMRSYRTIV
jgi:hypothetical protein